MLVPVDELPGVDRVELQSDEKRKVGKALLSSCVFDGWNGARWSKKSKKSKIPPTHVISKGANAREGGRCCP